MTTLNINISNLELKVKDEVPELKLDIGNIAINTEKKTAGRIRTKEEQDILDKMYAECDFVTSFSKLDFSCDHEFERKYVLNDKTAIGSAYTKIGSDCHDINEKLYLNQMKTEDCLQAFLDRFKSLKVYGLNFPSPSIELKYRDNLVNFYTNFQVPKNLFKTREEPIDESGIVESELYTEIFIWKIFNFKKSGIKIGIYGYADLVHKEIRLINDKEELFYRIGDFKTSSKNDYMPNNKNSLKKGRQLVLYAEMQNNVISGGDISKYTKNIECYWNMLKYCNLRIEKPIDKILGKLKLPELKELVLKLDKDYNVNKKTIKSITEYIVSNFSNNELIEYFDIDDIYETHKGIDRFKLVDYILKVFPDNAGEKFKKTGDVKDLNPAVKDRIFIEDFIIDYKYNNETRKELMEWILDRYYKIQEMKSSGVYCPNMTNLFYCGTLCGFRLTCKHYQDLLKENQNSSRALELNM